MLITERVKKILEFYNGESVAVKSKLYQILMHGKLAGTGKMIILPVDQGFEHGPTRSFASNEAAYDPDYFFQIAIEAGLNAYAAPLGLLSASADKFAGQIPTILKLNSNNSLATKKNEPDQSITSSVKDAVRLGCAGVGFTIYPGSSKAHDMMEEAREIIYEAKSYGLITVIWSYPRGGDLLSNHENALDVCAYGAHMAALLGAHIIKVKLPSQQIAQTEAQQIHEKYKILAESMSDRVKYIMKSCFNGKRLVVFSGGATKSDEDVINEIKAIHDGGGSGSIIGRNAFQRSNSQAKKLLDSVIQCYAN